MLCTSIHTQSCVWLYFEKSVCEPFCSLLFMLTYVRLSICVHSASALFICCVCLLLKLSVQFWIKAKQVSLWLQTDGRPHAETRILSSHLFLSLISLFASVAIFILASVQPGFSLRGCLHWQFHICPVGFPYTLNAQNFTMMVLMLLIHTKAI